MDTVTEPVGSHLMRAMERHWHRASSSGEQIAGEACLSRYHFQRVFRGETGETPGRMRRRLLLERAACDLRTTDKSVTEIAFEANYRSVEGFLRAFKAALGQTPQAYRRAARQVSLLPGASGVHFDPRTGGTYSALPKGVRNMDLMDRMLESDHASKRALFERARLLTDAQLDAPLAFRHNLMPWVEPAKTLRESLSWMVTSEWVDQMMRAVGHEPEEDAYRKMSDGRAVDEMRARFEGYHAAFRAFARSVRDRSEWDREWVDDGCDPPHTFAVGAVIEQTLTWDIAYRLMLHRQLEQFGFGDGGEIK